MNDVKATEKTNETKKKETDNGKKEQPTSLMSKVKAVFSFLLFVIIAIIAAFPFIAPEKFNNMTQSIFHSSTPDSDSKPQHLVDKNGRVSIGVDEVPQGYDTTFSKAVSLPDEDIELSISETPDEASTEAVVTILEQPSDVSVEIVSEESTPENQPEPEEDVVNDSTSDNMTSDTTVKNSAPLSATVGSLAETEGKISPATTKDAFVKDTDIKTSIADSKIVNEGKVEEEIHNLQERSIYLEGRIATLEKQLAYYSFDTKRRVLTVIAAMDLQKAVDKGQNFKKELDNLTVLSSQSIKQELEKLEPLTDKIKSNYALKQEFDSLFKKVLSLPSQTDSDSFWTKIENIFRSLVVIRKTNDNTGDFQAKLNKASKLVNEYKFSEALEELNGQPVEVEIIFSQWKEDVLNKETTKQVISKILNDALVNFGVFNTNQQEGSK